MKENIFGSFWTKINHRILINIQACLRYKWNLGRRHHVATTLLHQKSLMCGPKLSNTTVVKLARTLQEGYFDQLQWSNQLRPGHSQHQEFYHPYERNSSTNHTDIKHNAYEVHIGLVEQGASLLPCLRWVHSKGGIYWSPAQIDPTHPAVILEFEKERYCSHTGTSYHVGEKLAAPIAVERRLI